MMEAARRATQATSVNLVSLVPSRALQAQRDALNADQTPIPKLLQRHVILPASTALNFHLQMEPADKRNALATQGTRPLSEKSPVTLSS